MHRPRAVEDEDGLAHDAEVEDVTCQWGDGLSVSKSRSIARLLDCSMGPRRTVAGAQIVVGGPSLHPGMVEEVPDDREARRAWGEGTAAGASAPADGGPGERREQEAREQCERGRESGAGAGEVHGDGVTVLYCTS